MKFGLTFIYLLCFVGYFPAYGNDFASCRQRIHLLPQSHAPDGLTGVRITPEDANAVAASQLKIASYIERFPARPVFTEQAAAQDFTWDMVFLGRREVKKLELRLRPIHPGSNSDLLFSRLFPLSKL